MIFEDLKTMIVPQFFHIFLLTLGQPNQSTTAWEVVKLAGEFTKLFSSPVIQTNT
jgi:hypothetical protein